MIFYQPNGEKENKMDNDTIFGKYPVWDCNIYYDAGSIVIYGGTLCVASGLGIEPETWDA